jgi:flagellar biosynthesis protein FlhG
VEEELRVTNAGARTIAFISNKGGVGKTHIAINLAIQYAKEGRRVLLVDTDLGSANADLRLGIRPLVTLNDFFERRSDIFQCLVPTEYGFHFLAGKSGEFKLANLAHQQKIRLLRAFDRLVHEGGYTDIFFDLGAGIGSRVLDFALVCDECVIVATPQDIVAAYAALKACWTRYTSLSEMHYFKRKTVGKIIRSADDNRRLRINFLVNQVENLQEAKRVYLRILDVARTFFYTDEGQSLLPLRYIGGVPYVHGLLRTAERSKVPALVMYPHHPFAKSVHDISLVMLDKQAVAPNRMDVPFGDRVRGMVQAWVS